MRGLDAFLSEPLRQSEPSELARCRVLAGANACALVFVGLNLVAWLLAPSLGLKFAMIAIALSALGTLLLLRGANPRLPAVFFCLSHGVGIIFSVLFNRDSLGGIHAVMALSPAFAVYLVGPRMGLAMALGQSVLLDLIHPYLLTRAAPLQICFPPEQIWPMHLSTITVVMAIWVLGALHSTARNEVQQTLEKTLGTLHDSERKLSSLFENTDDMVCSLDAQGRLLVANSSLKQAYTRIFSKEPVPGQPLCAQMDPSISPLWRERFGLVLHGQRLKFEQELTLNNSPFVLETCLGPIPGKSGEPVGLTLFSRDVTARRQAETRMGEMHRTLVDVSRQAGMAEVATGVLHNVGNTLNNVNVSASIVTDKLRKLKVPKLAQATELLAQHTADLPAFLSSDPRGQQLPSYLQALSRQLGEQQEALEKEVEALTEGVEHLKSFVSMQQRYARPAEAIEEVAVPQLIDDALRLHATSLERLGIRIERDYAKVPSLSMDRHQLMQILINLLRNAQHALEQEPGRERILRIRVRPSADGQHLVIQVEDNGMGICPKHLPCLFSQGFTTKTKGHGFGLHLSALAAQEMKARLSCASEGINRGATFTLELPLAFEEALKSATPGA